MKVTEVTWKDRGPGETLYVYLRDKQAYLPAPEDIEGKLYRIDPPQIEFGKLKIQAKFKALL